MLNIILICFKYISDYFWLYSTSNKSIESTDKSDYIMAASINNIYTKNTYTKSIYIGNTYAIKFGLDMLVLEIFVSEIFMTKILLLDMLYLEHKQN